MNEPDYEVTAQFVTFRGLTRIEAVSKMLTHLSEHSENWNREEDLPIQTGFQVSIEGDSFYASAMKSYKRKKP